MLDKSMVIEGPEQQLKLFEKIGDRKDAETLKSCAEKKSNTAPCSMSAYLGSYHHGGGGATRYA